MSKVSNGAGTDTAKAKKMREGWEKAPYCFCHLLGRMPAHTKPRLGVPRCRTCGKKVR